MIHRKNPLLPNAQLNLIPDPKQTGEGQPIVAVGVDACD